MSKDKIIVEEIEKPVSIKEPNDIVDLFCERHADKRVDKTGVTQYLFGKDAKETRVAFKNFLRTVKDILPR